MTSDTPLHSTGSTAPGTPALVDLTRRIEGATALDSSRRTAQRVADMLLANRTRRELLHGTWLGHAVHPVMTDLPLGCWVSASLLDLFGGTQSRPAATRLVGIGLAAAVPTAVTGLAEWGVAGQREQRVGLVHAASNTVALGLYAASYAARCNGRHRRGAVLALAGSAAAGAGGYLGGHLVSARKLSTRHPVFDRSGEAPSTGQPLG
jgi:uncharacterized membrane protein